MSWKPRAALEDRLSRAVRQSPITLLAGPRQCGKTSLARRIARHTTSHLFDLEDPETPLRPEALGVALRDLRGLVIIDEC